MYARGLGTGTWWPTSGRIANDSTVAAQSLHGTGRGNRVGLPRGRAGIERGTGGRAMGRGNQVIVEYTLVVEAACSPEEQREVLLGLLDQDDGRITSVTLADVEVTG